MLYFGHNCAPLPPLKEFFERHKSDLWMFAPELDKGSLHERALEMSLKPEFHKVLADAHEREQIWKLQSSEKVCTLRDTCER